MKTFAVQLSQLPSQLSTAALLSSFSVFIQCLFRDFTTELQLASFIGHLPFVQALVAAKVDVNAQTE